MNKYRPHILVLPEDDADRELANGFVLELNSRNIQVLPPVGGWKKVLDDFDKKRVSGMRNYPLRRIVLLMDFDDQINRLSEIESQIPDDLKERVYVLGVLSEPEKLRSDINKSFEEIGEALANDCFNNTNKLWGHDLLKHNKANLERICLLKDEWFGETDE